MLVSVEVEVFSADRVKFGVLDNEPIFVAAEVLRLSDSAGEREVVVVQDNRVVTDGREPVAVPVRLELNDPTERVEDLDA